MCSEPRAGASDRLRYHVLVLYGPGQWPGQGLIKHGLEASRSQDDSSCAQIQRQVPATDCGTMNIPLRPGQGLVKHRLEASRSQDDMKCAQIQRQVSATNCSIICCRYKMAWTRTYDTRVESQQILCGSPQ